MAFRRRRIKDRETGEFITEPVRCSRCKEQKAFTTMHGHNGLGGKTICDDCFPEVKSQVNRELFHERDSHMTEADYQTWDRLY